MTNVISFPVHPPGESEHTRKRRAMVGISSVTISNDGHGAEGWCFVEWSDTQKSFHIAPPHESLRSNFRAWLDGTMMDYRPLALCRSREAAHAFIEAAVKLRPDCYEGRRDGLDPV